MGLLRILFPVMLVTFFALDQTFALASCQNSCSSKGLCLLGACTCDPGFSGTDCSVGSLDASSSKSRAFVQHGLPVLPSLKRLDIVLVTDNRHAEYTQILAESLATRSNHRVRVLLCRGNDASPLLARYKLEVFALSPADLRLSSTHLADSCDVYNWLRTNANDADVVHFLASPALAYYTALSKKQSLAFDRTALVTLGSESAMSSSSVGDALEVEFMRRQALELVDFTISPSAKMASTMFADPHIFDHSSFFDQGHKRWLGFQNWAANEMVTKTATSLHSISPVDKVGGGSVAQPLVSVCLVHRNRPQYLKHALASLEAQDYSNFEVILVDDGSDQKEAMQFLVSLEGRFASRGWRIIRQKNKYLGAARNVAAKHAKGQYLLFMDDDNYAKPNEISTFVRIALRTRADVLTSFVQFFSGSGVPSALDSQKPPFIFLGGAPGIGALRNCFGDANSFVRRAAFFEIGGFTEDFGVGYEDWEFFAKATMIGKQIQVVPESLYFYRFTPNSMQRGGTLRSKNRMRSLRPYISDLTSTLAHVVTSNLVSPSSSLRDEQSTTFYGFYGEEFYGWTPSPTPSPLIGQATITITLDVPCSKFNATLQAIQEWAATYLNVSISAIQIASVSCPSSAFAAAATATTKSAAAEQADADKLVEITFTVFDTTPSWESSECPNGCSAQALVKKLQAAQQVLTFPVFVSPPDQFSPPSSQPQSSHVNIAAIIVPVVFAVVAVVAVVGLVVVRRRRLHQKAGFQARMANVYPIARDTDVIFV
mmetsp:Transcript_21188/g.35058  ORF Transcript_21188/g.35058 Transcript_21188/m.35058 type:complete len:768 (+) Transcript_21188:306-2609(+)